LVALNIGISAAQANALSDVHPSIKLKPNDIPNWVVPVIPSTVSNPEVEKSRSVGVRYRLLSLQHNVVDKGVDYFIQAHMQITTPAGLSRGNLEIEFDPDHQSLHFYTIGIRRGNHFIDLSSFVQARLLDRERQWEEAALLLGRKTLLVLFPDLRVGDTIEYSYSIEARNPLWHERFFLARPLKAGAAVDRYYFRLRWPEHRPIRYSLPQGFAPVKDQGHWYFTYDSDQQFVASQRLGSSTNVLSSEGLTDPQQMGADFSGWFEFSEIQSWPELAHWINDIWSEVQSPHAAQVLLKHWLKLSDYNAEAEIDPLMAKVLAAVHWVQDEVRYLGLELGEGSLKPRSAMQVLSTRFGDCKDKALLLVTLLQAMGVEAEPVLVNSESTMNYALPMPAAFNHVIVQIHWRGQTLWVDPTRKWQGGQLLSLHTSDFERGLVLDAEHSRWLDRPFVQPVNFNRTVFDLDATNTNRLTLKLETELRGQAADFVRGQIHRYGKNWFAQSRARALQTAYGPVEAISALKVLDQRQQNIIQLIEHYEMMADAELPESLTSKTKASKAVMAPNQGLVLNIKAHALMPIAQALEASIALGGGVMAAQRVEQITRIRLPENTEFKLPPSWSTQNNAFDYVFSASGDHSEAIFKYALMPHVLPEGVSATERSQLESAMTRLRSSLSYRLPIHHRLSVMDKMLQARFWLVHWSIQTLKLYQHSILTSLPFVLVGLLGLTMGVSLQSLFWSARRGRKSRHLFRPRPLVFAGCSVGTLGLYALAWLWLVYGTSERRQKLRLWADKGLWQPPVVALAHAIVVKMMILVAAFHTGQWSVLLLSGCAFLTLIPRIWVFFDWYQEHQTRAHSTSGTQMRAPNLQKITPLSVIRVSASSAKRQPLASEAA